MTAPLWLTILGVYYLAFGYPLAGAILIVGPWAVTLKGRM